MSEAAIRTPEAARPAARPAGDPLAEYLSGLTLPAGGFSARARAEARQRLETMGLPGPRDEYWRYTNPALFNAPQPAAISISAEAHDSPLFDDIDRLRIVFVDGQFDAAASDPLEGAGIEIESLAAADRQPGHWAVDLYGRLEAAEQTRVKRPFAALNTAAARDGLLIRVTGKVERPLHVIYRRRAEQSDVHIRHVVRLEPGAELTLLETGMMAARSNQVIEVDVAPGAQFHHIMGKRASHPKVGVGYLFARVAEKGLFKSFELAVNGHFVRNEAVIEMTGDDAVAHVAAAVLGDGAQTAFHHDNTVYITHGAERGESRQVYKKVLKGGAVGVFQGKILVKPGAQKTDGYQISQALLLDEHSQFLAKPELEIYADDVICSHGSTTGALDEEALFYLRSRGVPKEQAVVLLVLSFLGDALDEVEDERLRERISERLEAWLIERTHNTAA